MPSTPPLTRNRFVAPLLDLPDKLVAWVFPEFRDLPPNRFRVRVGIRNRVFFNHANFMRGGWIAAARFFALDLAGPDSRILEVGSGCGRFALALRTSDFFRGTYVGVDVDREMVEWCSRNLADERFRFVHADVYNKVYNPSGSQDPYTIPLEPSSRDLVMSQSVFSHLLDPEIKHYMRESFRVLGDGGRMAMSAFCLDHMNARGHVGGRWTFPHRIGPAYVESIKYPEAAVAYESDYLIDAARETGFASAEILPYPIQSLLVAGK